MSGAPEDLDLLAAEYVLGALDEAAAHEIALRAQTEPALQAAIATWQERLEPLTLLAAPEAPPVSLWRRIGVSTGMHVGQSSPGIRPRPRAAMYAPHGPAADPVAGSSASTTPGANSRAFAPSSVTAKRYRASERCSAISEATSRGRISARLTASGVRTGTMRWFRPV